MPPFFFFLDFIHQLLFSFKMSLQEHVKEKLKLVLDFLHVDAQDQLTSLEEKMKSSEISKVSQL